MKDQNRITDEELVGFCSIAHDVKADVVAAVNALRAEVLAHPNQTIVLGEGRLDSILHLANIMAIASRLTRLSTVAMHVEGIHERAHRIHGQAHADTAADRLIQSVFKDGDQ